MGTQVPAPVKPSQVSWQAQVALGQGEDVRQAESKGNDTVNDRSAVPDEDRHAAAVRAFLARIQQQSRKAGNVDAFELLRLHGVSNPVGGATSETPLDQRQSLVKAKKSVWFNLGLNSVHEHTPYSEIYGRHPREFVFGRNAEMLPAGDRWGFRGLGEVNGDDCEEEESSDSEVEENAEDVYSEHLVQGIEALVDTADQ